MAAQSFAQMFGFDSASIVSSVESQHQAHQAAQHQVTQHKPSTKYLVQTSNEITAEYIVGEFVIKVKHTPDDEQTTIVLWNKNNDIVGPMQFIGYKQVVSFVNKAKYAASCGPEALVAFCVAAGVLDCELNHKFDWKAIENVPEI